MASLQNISWIQKIGELPIDKFNRFALVIAILGDLCYIGFIKLVLFAPEHIQTFLSEYLPSTMAKNVQMMPANMQNQLINLLNQSLNLFIILVFVSNILAYIFFLKRKKWAIGYLKGLAITGAIFAVFTIYEALVLTSFFWVLVFLLLIPAYLIMYRGIKKHYK